MAFKQAEHDLKLKDEVHRRKNMMNYEDQNEHFKENSNKIDLTEAQVNKLTTNINIQHICI